MLAGTLGVLVLGLAVASAWPRRALLVLLGIAAMAAAIGVFLYIRHAYVLSGAFSIVAIALPLVAAMQPRLGRHHGASRSPRLRSRRIPGDARHVDGHAAVETLLW